MSPPSPEVSPVLEPAQPAQLSSNTTASTAPAATDPSATAPVGSATDSSTTAPLNPTNGPSTTAPVNPTNGPSTTAPVNPTTNPSTTAPANAATEYVSTASTPALKPPAQTKYEKLNAGDRDWQWKIGMRVVLFIISFIGLGCAGWVVTNFSSKHRYYGYMFDSNDWEWIPWTLVTFVLTIVWSLACILVFWFRKDHSPLHPGAQVGVDLILWLGYIATGLCAVGAVISIREFGSSGAIGQYSRAEWTYVSENNTWVFDSNSSSSSYYTSPNSSRNCKTPYYYSNSGFESCEQLDEFVNYLWRTKNARFNTELCACVCQFLALFLHFVLFIWACVDTHRYRKERKVAVEAFRAKQNEFSTEQ